MQTIHQTSTAIVTVYRNRYNNENFVHVRKFELTDDAVTKGDDAGKVIEHDGNNYRRTKQGLALHVDQIDDLVAALKRCHVDETIDVLKANKETLRVSANEFRDVLYANIRWYYNAKGKRDLIPSRNGISIPATAVGSMVKAMTTEPKAPAKPKASKPKTEPKALLVEPKAQEDVLELTDEVIEEPVKQAPKAKQATQDAFDIPASLKRPVVEDHKPTKKGKMPFRRTTKKAKPSEASFVTAFYSK